MTDGKIMLTVQEVAEILRLGPRTVRILIKRGDLPSVKVSASVRVLSKDLDHYIALSRRGAVS